MNPLIGAQFQTDVNILHFIMRTQEDLQLGMGFKTASTLNRKRPKATLKDPEDLPFPVWLCYLIQDCLNILHSKGNEKNKKKDRASKEEQGLQTIRYNEISQCGIVAKQQVALSSPSHGCATVRRQQAVRRARGSTLV